MENFNSINEAVEALERSKKTAEALNKTAAVFLSSNSDTFENMMTVGMGIIANVADLDRLNLWRNYSTPEGLFASQIYRWDRAAGGTTEPTAELRSVSYSQVAPQWEKIFKNDESVNSTVSQITGNEGKMMVAFGAKSVFVTPIFIKNEFWGFLLYSDHRNERVFDNCCVEMMKSAAFLCANAVVRAEMEHEINTGNKLNELQLAKLNLVIKSTKIGLWDMEINKADPVNPDNTVIFSDDVRKMLGYSNEEDYPNKIRTWGEGLHPEDRDRAVEALTNHLFDKTGNTPYYLEFRLRRKDGEYIYIRASGETIRDNEGNAVRTAGALKDITEEKNILLNTEKLRAEAEAASMAKSNFLSNMSHEIRTPMNAIIGMTVIGKSADDVSRKDYCLEKIENASQHLLGVINDILDMSKIEANKFELSSEEFDFEKMLQRVVNIIAFRADEKMQKLSIHIDKSIPKSLIGDDQRLAQVITNLLGNAVKFTPEEGFIKLDTRFLGKEDDLYAIQVTVTDSGIGISEEQQQQLFQSFQQAETGTSRKFGGTGLGLVISKNIIELMGGQIELTSEIGSGSSFSFTFKARRGNRKTPGLSEIGISWGNVSIMAVDDDQEILDYFKEVLHGFGSDCDVALSGQEALANIGVNGMYDIYFVDWKMPDMDGIMLAKELKAKSKSPEHTIVIMISAAEWSSIADKARKAGVDKFLSKPLFPSAIADVITEAIGSNHLPKEEKNGHDDVFKGYKILLAEDVDINREIVEALVEPTQLEVDCAENGIQAVALFEKSPDAYDLILMDVQMPEMDGYEATRNIRAFEKKLMEKSNNRNLRKQDDNTSTSFAEGETRSNNRNLRKQIPIIAMTANVFKEDVEKCLDAGMNDHIGKPVNIDEFFRMLRRYLPK